MTKPKMGRPTKEEALSRAIEAMGGLEIDYQLADPRNILAAIAADPAASESARIRACVVLLGGSIIDYECRKKSEKLERDLQATWYPNGMPDEGAAALDPGVPDNEISRRAIEIMRTGTSRRAL